MPLLIHRIPHVIALLLLSFLCLLAARSVNLTTELWLESRFSASPPPTPKRASARKELSAPLVLEPMARLLGMSVRGREPVLPVESGGSEPVPNTLGLRLLGTLLSRTAIHSFASILEGPSHRTHSVWMGSTLRGAQVIAIERTRVLVLNAGRVEAIGPGEEPAPRAAQPLPVSMPGGVVRQVGPNQYEFSRKQLDDSLAHLDVMSMQMRIVPVISNGEARGFKVFAIRSGSLFEQLGLLNGDVLRRINGLSIDSAERALEVYTRMKEASRIELEVERNGSPLRMTYTIQN